MKTYRIFLGLLLVLLLSVSTAQAQAPRPPQTAGGEPQYAVTGGSATETFTYQGYLEDGGKPANGYYDFGFYLYDSGATGMGTLISDCGLHEHELVTDGIFAFNLYPTSGMQETFDGKMLWIEVRVKPNGTASYFALPRQPITAVPYAWSLKPGAVIQAYSTKALLELRNTYTNTASGGAALTAYGGAPTVPTIAGNHTGDGPGVYGSATGSYPAVEGMHYGNGAAVGGYATSGHGVWGHTTSDNASGVVGLQNAYVYTDLGGYSRPGGFFGGRNGVAGVTRYAYGYAVLGYNRAASEGWAGHFQAENGNGVSISTPVGTTALSVAGGTKNAVVSTDAGDRLLYTEESTEVWFTDYGFGQLNDGEAVVVIDPLFAQTVNLDEPYHVFVQVYGDAEVYVTGRTATQFEVQLREGDDAVEFSYRIVGKRLQYEDARLEPAPAQNFNQAVLDQTLSHGGQQ
ncbi:MAG: hypothetical protein JXA21_11580 [Anaerolineae bacterium]|nr:hypothetical protein [Anaerolineae bacterium]